MSTFRSDPLLGIAKALLTFTMIMFVIGIVALGVGAAALVVMKTMATANLVEHGAAPDIYWAILLMLPLVAAMLALSYRFAENLRAIVRTVEQGDPFIPDNALRLRTMAWLTLAIQLLAVPIAMVGSWIEQAAEKMGEVHTDAEISTNGLLLALVLFILARVFRTGAQMRDDLEGTV